MILQPFSDIHNYDLSFMPKKTNADFLICAGDMDQGRDAPKWANKVIDYHGIPMFSGLGNHDFWSTSHDPLTIDEWDTFYKENSSDKIRFLDNETVIVEDVAFIFSTLWTDFDNENSLTIHLAEKASKDFKKIIMPDYNSINAFNILAKFEASKLFITQELEKHQDKKCVVVTHFPPSITCNLQMNTTALSYYWCGQVENLISIYQPTLWVSGHMHNNFDRMFGNTRMIMNPAGKVVNNVAQNPYFKFDFTVEI